MSTMSMKEIWKELAFVFNMEFGPSPYTKQKQAQQKLRNAVFKYKLN